MVGEVEDRAWSAVRSFGEESLRSEFREDFRMFDPRLRVDGRILAASLVWLCSFATLVLLEAAIAVCADMSKCSKGRGDASIEFRSLSAPHTSSCSEALGNVFGKILLSETQV